jgi:catechol-2,3-dioxygenase
LDTTKRESVALPLDMPAAVALLHGSACTALRQSIQQESNMSDFRLEHLNIPARDPVGLAQWYATTFDLKADRHLARGPGVLIAFEQGEPLNRADLHIGFRVESIEALNEWARRFDAETSSGAEFTTFKVTDPEGNSVEMYTPNA